MEPPPILVKSKIGRVKWQFEHTPLRGFYTDVHAMQWLYDRWTGTDATAVIFGDFAGRSCDLDSFCTPR
jgi:hypothetical protein